MRQGLACLVLIACGHPATTTPPPTIPPPTEVPVPKPTPDLVAVITAAGQEAPTGLDWGDAGQLPAKDIAVKGEGFKNLQLLGSVTGNRLMAGMQSMEANLGKKCKYCHEPKAWESDEKAPKKRARSMIEMANALNTKFFGGETRITCLTCHRGESPPPTVSDPSPDTFKKPVHPPPALSDADAQKPAGEVYKNIRTFKQMPARQLLFVMGLFTVDLGVECTHCHDDKDWAADTKKPKQRTREMVELVGFAYQTYFSDQKQSPVGCLFCHRGKVKPPRVRTDL